MNSKLLLKGITMGLLMFLTFKVSNSVNAQVSYVEAHNGSIENVIINEGETIRFTGSLDNLGNLTVWVFSMNATFIELSDQENMVGSHLIDFSKEYSSDTVILNKGDVHTDHFEENITLNPSRYNISIGFTVYNSSIADNTKWEIRYALVNQTVEVISAMQSTSNRLEIDLLVPIVIGIIILSSYQRIKIIKQ